MENKQIHSVQALRGIAALAVLAFHYRYTINMQFPGVGERLFGWGAIGVDLFFVLSGFVITLSVSRLASGPHAAWQFIQRRMLRLLPAYYVLLLLTFALGGGMSLFHYQDKVDNLISALTFTTVSADNGPFYVDDSGLYGIRWTLNYEIWFYLLMACSLLLRQRWIMLSALLAATLLLVPLLNGQPLTLETQGYALGYGMLNLITNPVIWTFAAGVAIGLAWPALLRLPVSLRRLLLVVSLVWTVWHIVDRTHVAHGMSYSGVVLSLLLMAVAVNDDLLSRLTPRALIWLGNISYSLYLIHTVMMRLVEKRIPVTGVAQFLVALALSLTVAWLSQRYIEPLGYRLFTSRSAQVKTA